MDKPQKSGNYFVPLKYAFVHASLNLSIYAFLSRDDDNPRTESINSDPQRGLDRRLRHTTLNTEQNQLVIKVSATLVVKY